MAEEKKFQIPSGLPARFVGGRDEFKRLCDFLGIQNRQQRQKFLAISSVKRAVRHMKWSVGRLSTSDRQRELITAFYKIPEARRVVWRNELICSEEARVAATWSVPSLEHHALRCYDATFRQRDIDKASLTDSLGEFPDAVASIADATEWQRPALAVWPDIHRDVSRWKAMPDNRRDVTTLAVFAIATILDDVRFLQWAADRVDLIAEEFAAVLGNSHDETQATADDDVGQKWKHTCDAIAATARLLGGDPPQPQHLKDLRRHMHVLDDLHESLVKVLETTDPEKLLQSVRKSMEETLVEAPFMQSVAQMHSQWRLAYPIGVELDIESLSADVDRLPRELPEALKDWHAKRARKEDFDKQLEDVKRELRAITRQDASAASSHMDQFSLEDREGELHDELRASSGEIRDARNHIWAVVAPKEEKFDPGKDYRAALEKVDPHVDTVCDLQRTPDGTAVGDPPSGVEDETEDVRDGDELPEGGNGSSSGIASEEGGVSTELAKQKGDENRCGASRAGPPGSVGDEARQEGGDGPTKDSALDSGAPIRGITQVPQDAPATTALWRALGNGRPGIAYRIALHLADQGRPCRMRPPADVIAASMLAMHVQSADSQVVGAIRLIMERIDSTELLPDDLEDDDKDAVSLLLFSAALRPALLAPVTGATSLLRRVHMSASLAPAYELGKVVAEHADRLQGVQLDATLLQPTLTGTWQQEFEAFVTRVKDWHTRAGSKRNLFGRANRVWHDLLAARGCLAELTELMSSDNATNRTRVEDIRAQIGDRKAFSDLVRRTDRKSQMGDPIQGKAFNQLWNDVQEAVELSGKWLRLVATKPDPGGFLAQRIESLRDAIEQYGRNAIVALDQGGSVDRRVSCAAALKYARHAVNDLLQLFGNSIESAASDLDPDVILSRDLLYVTELDLDMKFRPVRKDVGGWLDLLLNTDSHAKTPRAAFDARFARNDLIGAQLACEFVEDVGDSDADDLRASLVEKIDEYCQKLRADRARAEANLEGAFCRGQIDADERNDMAAELIALRELVSSSPSTPLSLDFVDVVSSAFPKLATIDRRIAEARARNVEQARDRLRKVPDKRLSDDAKATVEKTIEQGYVLTANEQIARLEKGETVAPSAVADDPFLEFMQLVGDIESARQNTKVEEIVQSAANRQAAAGVSFENLSQDAAKQAKNLLGAWYGLARTRRVDTKLLQDLLQGLGFNVFDIKKDRLARGRLRVDVTTEAIEDRALCPSRQFGSEAGGRYRMLLNWERPADESIYRAIGGEIDYPTVVFHFGCLGAEREKLRMHGIQGHRLFLVVDESLMLFLASRQARRLSALFRCTLPFSATHPYSTTSGLVPPELFYGRERERQAVMDRSGTCFIYGGRQLGKTALLRRVERDFNRSRETYVAKWIDLKVNEIGYARGARDIWSLLQRELRSLCSDAKRRELDPDDRKQVEAFLHWIRRWLDAQAGRRLILLLDEADEFLVQDAESDFRESARLKGLMDDTERRFKVVFAGLHNVLRTTRQANHPLAHLGDPICVGAMLSNGEWKQAHALVQEPLRSVGCGFERDDLDTRILAQTNYYPSLIQLYGTELVRRLRDSTKAFPYKISDDDIDGAYASIDLRSAIRERFLLTLQLDQRYEVIAYALAFELHGGIDLNVGLERRKIMDVAKDWWHEGFELRDVEFDMLLHEMEGLGVLRAVEPDRYTLRNPNILLLLGGQEEICEAMSKERTRPTVYEPASFRARYPNDQPSNTRRGPLTYEQETNLRKGGVAVISGCKAGGLDGVEEFVSNRIGGELFCQLDPAKDADEFEQQLRKLRPARNRVTVYLVPKRANWSVSWLRTAKRVLQRRAQGRRMWSRVAFIATPETLWLLLANAENSDLDGVEWIGAGPWDEMFVRRWLQDNNLTANADDAKTLLDTSGGWPAMLNSFSTKKTRRSWKTRIEALERETLKDELALIRNTFGLSDEAKKVFRVLVNADDPFDHETIELVADELGLGREEVQRRVAWGEKLGLLSFAGQNRWTFNSLFRRVLKASAGE